MSSPEGLRQRAQEPVHRKPLPDSATETTGSGVASGSSGTHPAGPIKHGGPKQLLRATLLLLYFIFSSLMIFGTQLMGCPLYFIDKNYYYALMALTKQHFGLVMITLTQWWSPTMVRVSGDRSVRGQIRQTDDGRLETDFPERLILIANHQIYTDWLYLWWMAYTSRMHGHIFIILKKSLQYIPLLGLGMTFFGFIFLSRNWAKDKSRFSHRLQKLNMRHDGPMPGKREGWLDPMWLMIFPEGTNMSKNGRAASKKWSERSGRADMEHVLLPRSTGLLYCLQELKDTVDYIYDCTMAYEGIPRGQYGQDLFTIRSIFLQGRPAKSVNMHWRRFAIKSIPIHDAKEFEDWVNDRWTEKNALMEHFMQNGRFPADDGADPDILLNGSQNGFGKKVTTYVETEVMPRNPLEFLQIYVPTTTAALVVNIFYKLYISLFGGRV